VSVVRTWLAASACGLVLAGCGDGSSPTTPQESAVDEPTSSPSTPASGPEAQAVADLAQRIDVAEGDIEVVAVEDVTWRDGSRGCAEPGMMYTQALIDGSRIILRAGGRTYEYHSGGSQPPALCEKPTE
jgi:hypothetical protein